MDDNSVKVAIVQDRLDTFGGGSRVVKHLAEEIPGKADIITGNFEPDSTYDFSSHTVVELQKNSFTCFILSRLQIDWGQYDIAVLSGNRPQFVQWWKLPIPVIRYCHSPTRTFWSLRDQKFRESTLRGKLARTAVAPMYRSMDVALNRKHDLILTNSHNIRSQVDRFYGLDATVVYPPIDVDKFKYSPHDGYWLSVNRLVPKKRVELQIDAFESINQKLVIIGSVDQMFSEHGNRLKSRIRSLPNVRLEESVSESQLVSLYANSKGVLYTPVYEDFGIVPVEAMASGKPVIAVAEGGPLETIQDSLTGWLVPPNSNDIMDIATQQHDWSRFRESCIARANSFDINRFKESISQIITKPNI
jgi:glycosyltransferase involved in cell wall biosynthesis